MPDATVAHVTATVRIGHCVCLSACQGRSQGRGAPVSLVHVQTATVCSLHSPRSHAECQPHLDIVFGCRCKPLHVECQVRVVDPLRRLSQCICRHRCFLQYTGHTHPCRQSLHIYPIRQEHLQVAGVVRSRFDCCHHVLFAPKVRPQRLSGNIQQPCRFR